MSASQPPYDFKRFVNERMNLGKEQLNNVLDRVESILQEEDKLVKIPEAKVFVMGDTHGNIDLTFHAIKHLFQFKEIENEGGQHSIFDKLIFLGDFIDRGPYSVKNVNLLMSLKADFPEKVILIRGNHETREINKRFDFYGKVLQKYGIKTFEHYNQVFSRLPIAFLTWNKVFGVHGGIPEGLEKLNQLNGLTDEVNPENTITFQILWNDPVEKDGWFYKNFRGKYSKKFGRNAFKHFVKKNDIQLVLRAHQRHKKGFKNFFAGSRSVPKLVSLDSCSTKWLKSTQKVFVIESSGEYKICTVEFFQKKALSHL